MTRRSDPRKQSIYFPAEMCAEIQREAQRQGRSASWLVQQAWQIARRQMQVYPGRDNQGPHRD